MRARVHLFSGALQMCVGIGTITLGVMVQRRMAELQDRLDHDPEEKKRLYAAFAQVDPNRTGHIHVGELATLSVALSLDKVATEQAAEGFDSGGTDFIRLDEFKSWYTDSLSDASLPALQGTDGGAASSPAAAAPAEAAAGAVEEDEGDVTA